MNAWHEAASVLALVGFAIAVLASIRCDIQEREQLEREGCEVVSTRRVWAGKVFVNRDTWRCPDGREFER